MFPIIFSFDTLRRILGRPSDLVGHDGLDIRVVRVPVQLARLVTQTAALWSGPPALGNPNSGQSFPCCLQERLFEDRIRCHECWDHEGDCLVGGRGSIP